MTTDLAISEGKLPLVMKSGQVHWITPTLHERLKDQLANQQGHTFIRLSELDVVINSAEVEGVYSIEQYGDAVKIKQGMWQCEYRKWHHKKNECECKREWVERHQAKLKDAARAEDSRPLTPAERDIQRKAIEENRKILEAKGVLVRGKRTGGYYKRSALNNYEKKYGTPYAVPEGATIEEDVGTLTNNA